MTSRHLESRITHNYGSVAMHVVFIDIVGYEKRKPAMQCEVLRGFIPLINHSLRRLAENYASRVPLDLEELSSSILKVTTTEGVAVVFTFEQWPSAAHDFVQCLEHTHVAPQRHECRRFTRDKWCDCHGDFHIATEVRQGTGFVYRDANDGYGVAGSTVDFHRRSRELEFEGELVGVGSAPPLRPPVLHLEL